MDVPDPLLWPRLALALVTVSALLVGVWAEFAPRSFYDSFPGAGRQWVAVDGPYNEHLVRDVGSLYLGLAAVAVAAVVVGGRTLLRVAAAALLVSGAPHLLYHLRHLDVYDTSDQIGNVVSLGLGVLLPVAVLVGCRSRDRSSSLLDRGGSARVPAAVAGAGGANP